MKGLWEYVEIWGNVYQWAVNHYIDTRSSGVLLHKKMTTDNWDT